MGCIACSLIRRVRVLRLLVMVRCALLLMPWLAAPLQPGMPAVVKDLKLEPEDVITLRPIDPPTGGSAGAGAPPCVEIEVAERGTLAPPPGMLWSRRLGHWEVVDEGARCYQLVLNKGSLLVLSVPGQAGACCCNCNCSCSGETRIYREGL
jgi:hypothetical protein